MVQLFVKVLTGSTVMANTEDDNVPMEFMQSVRVHSGAGDPHRSTAVRQSTCEEEDPNSYRGRLSTRLIFKVQHTSTNSFCI